MRASHVISLTADGMPAHNIAMSLTCSTKLAIGSNPMAGYT